MCKVDRESRSQALWTPWIRYEPWLDLFDHVYRNERIGGLVRGQTYRMLLRHSAPADRYFATLHSVTVLRPTPAMQPLFDCLSAHSALISTMAAASIVLLALTVLATPWAVSRLPSDYLLRRLNRSPARGVLALLKRVLRGFFGLLLVLLGVVMMVTPGPGVVMLLLGISVADFPGKNRLLVQLATRPAVFASLNWMRQRHGKPPFLFPSHHVRREPHR